MVSFFLAILVPFKLNFDLLSSESKSNADTAICFGAVGYSILYFLRRQYNARISIISNIKATRIMKIMSYVIIY